MTVRCRWRWAQSLMAPSAGGERRLEWLGPRLASQQSNAPLPPRYLSGAACAGESQTCGVSFRWYTATDFGPLYHLERVDTRDQTIEATEGTYDKPDRSAAVTAAESSRLGRAVS